MILGSTRCLWDTFASAEQFVLLALQRDPRQEIMNGVKLMWNGINYVCIYVWPFWSYYTYVHMYHDFTMESIETYSFVVDDSWICNRHSSFVVIYRVTSNDND
jgi:hypothetical protein